MIKFRLILFSVGVLWFILGAGQTYSYTYTSAPAYSADSYSPYHTIPAYPAQGAYGSYPTKTYGSYSNCGTMKVLEVLDNIFCHHTSHYRFSSSGLPKLDAIIENCEWIMDALFYEPAADWMEGAIAVMKGVKGEMHGDYADTSLIAPYNESEGETSSHSQGTSTSSTQGVSDSSTQVAKSSATQTLALHKEKLQTQEARTKGVKEKKGMIQQIQTLQTATTDTVENEKTGETLQDTVIVKVTETRQDKTTGSSQFSKLMGLGHSKLQSTKATVSDTRRKRMISDTLAAYSSRRRRARNAEYSSDNSCSLLSTIYCSEEKYDELLYNILDRIFKALDMLDNCLEELYFLILNIGCGDEDILVDAAILYGLVLGEYYNLFELAEYIFRVYEILELDESSHYRASSSESSPGKLQMVGRPMMIGQSVKPQAVSYVAQGYPFGYIQQAPQTPTFSYPFQQKQQQYRVGRDVSSTTTTSTPAYFIFV